MFFGMIQNFLKGFFIFFLWLCMANETYGSDCDKENFPLRTKKSSLKSFSEPNSPLLKRKGLNSPQQDGQKSLKAKVFSTPNSPLLKKRNSSSPEFRAIDVMTSSTSMPNSPYLNRNKTPSSALLDSASKKKRIVETFKASPDIINGLREKNMDHLEIVKVHCFSITMKNDGVDCLFTPQKQKVYEDFQMDPDEIERVCKEFKVQYPDTIRNPKILESSFLPSPTTFPFVSRWEQNDLRRNNFVFTLYPKDFLPEEVEETPEERRQRKDQQKLDFQRINSGFAPKKLKKIIKTECNIWSKHFAYIKMRKEQCTKKVNPAKKITRAEIEYSFKKLVADQLNHITVKGYTVYFSRETLNINLKNIYGETNLDLMKSEFCPIGADGNPMNYHHLTHHDFATHNKNCIIVLLSNELHEKCSGLLHFGKNTYLNLPQKKVYHPFFDEYRYLFNQEIANLF